MKRFLVSVLVFASVALAAETNATRMSASFTWHEFSASSHLSAFSNKSLTLGYLWGETHSARINVAFRRMQPFVNSGTWQYPRIEGIYYGHVGVEYIYFLKQSKQLNVLIGGGPALHITEKHDDKVYDKLLDRYTFGPAVSVIFGLDYFIFKNMAIRMQYSTFFQFSIDINNWYKKDVDGYNTIFYYTGHASFVDSFPHIGVVFYL